MSDLLTYKFRIKDAACAKKLAKMAGAVNFVWNYCNEISQFAAKRDRKWLSDFDLQDLTSGCSKSLGIRAQSIQAVCEEFALRRRITKKIRLAWRSGKKSLGWIPFKGQIVSVKDDRIRYGGKWLRFWKSRPLGGKIKCGSFNQDARGHWYVNLVCEVPAIANPGSDLVGIDLGLKDQMTLSTGEKFSRENLTKKYEERLAMAQRAGKRHLVKKIHAKITNTRKDWAHKTTTEIVKNSKFIAVGNVSSAKLAKTPMAKSVHDAGWHQIKSILEYKAIRLGVGFTCTDEAFSTVTCSACASRTGPSGLRSLGIRSWTCSACGAVHDRDVNAARNILSFGLGRETQIKGNPGWDGRQVLDRFAGKS